MHNDIVMTTEVSTNLYVSERLGIITAECVLGMNVFKDYFTSLTDFFGGRSKTTQNALRRGAEQALQELREQASSLGANAVIAVDIDYNQITNDKKSMVVVVASGTAVLLK